MRTTISILMIAIALSMNAQVKVRGQSNGSKPISPRNEPKSNADPNGGQNAHWGNGSFQGGISIGFGNGPYYGNPYPCNNYYNNAYNFKKATRNAIKAAKYMINDAVAFDTWNDIYSPLVAKAIRHYDYARQLYWWGNYQAAYNHAERARYLAWYSLQYFQDPDCYNGGGYQPDPYSDPYDPYYKKRNNGNVEGYKKKESEGNKSGENFRKDDLDDKLPGAGKNDREVLKSFDRSDDRDE